MISSDGASDPARKTDQPMRLLVHACCGPCLEYPARRLLDEGHQLTIYAFNPNIQPEVEHERRLAALNQLTDRLDLTLHAEGGPQAEQWLEHCDITESRCHMCYRVRLEAAARKARDLKIPFFTTTLLVSPYQDQDLIREAGEEAASRYGVTFYFRDFRDGYREGQAMAREDGLYRQKYCGCLPSIDQSRYADRIRSDHAALNARSTAERGRR